MWTPYPMSCHDPSHGGFYMAEGVPYIRIGLPPRVVSGDCLVFSCCGLTVFIVAAHIRCLVIGVVLVRIFHHLMFLLSSMRPWRLYLQSHARPPSW